MTTFCASLSKYISCVRIAKWALSNSDFLPIFTSERTEPHPSQVCKFWWKSYEVPLMKGLIVRRFTIYLSSHCSRFLNRQHKARAPYNIQGSRQFEGTGVLLSPYDLNTNLSYLYFSSATEVRQDWGFLVQVYLQNVSNILQIVSFWNHPASKKCFIPVV